MRISAFLFSIVLGAASVSAYAATTTGCGDGTMPHVFVPRPHRVQTVAPCCCSMPIYIQQPPAAPSVPIVPDDHFRLEGSASPNVMASLISGMAAITVVALLLLGLLAWLLFEHYHRHAARQLVVVEVTSVAAAPATAAPAPPPNTPTSEPEK